MNRFTEKLEDGRIVVRDGISSIHSEKYGRFFDGEAIDKLSRYEDNEDLFRYMYNREPPIIGDFISLLIKIIESTNGRFEDIAILTGEDLEKWERLKSEE